jgi:glyoxylase-like metal-dependent hydrolase (beta-lactamase superfamily II)
MYSNVSQEQFEQVLKEHNIQSEQIHIPCISLAVKCNESWLLVDTGLGEGIAPDAGKLLKNLNAEGIKPEEVSMVVLSHGHSDHAGGNIDSRGNPAFPKARYFMHKKEWDFWTSESNLAKMGMEEIFPFVNAKLLPIQSQLELIIGEEEILPGIRAIPAAGHTPGHMVLEISSGGDRLLSVSDAVGGHPMHIEHPDWHGLYDLEPERASIVRNRLLEQAATERLLVFASHFPFPGLGYVIQEGKSWHWKPHRDKI